MRLKIILFSLLATIGPQLSHAISMGSISDAISNNVAASNQAPTGPAIPTRQKTNTKEEVATTNKPQQTEGTFPNPALFIEDAAMTGYIHSQLILQRNIPGVSITTENAVVTLSGTMQTQEQADTVVKIASSVKGVKMVNTDRLVVLRPKATA
jgi:hypothetical protein